MLLPLAKNRKPLKELKKRQEEKWGRTQSVPRILSEARKQDREKKF